jgi:hypothetical protein
VKYKNRMEFISARFEEIKQISSWDMGTSPTAFKYFKGES